MYVTKLQCEMILIIIVNAVHPLTGKKLQFSKNDYIAMKDEVNRIGKVHGFTETDFRKRGKNSRTAVEKKIMLKGGTCWKEELREVIAEATKNSTTPDKFKEYLDTCYGVKITRDGKDYSYLHPNKLKPIRGEKLGTNYTKTELIRKLGEQNHGTKTATYHGRGSGFIGKSGGNGVVRTGKPTHGGSAGRLIIEGIVGIEREMQRLNFAAQCADRGTDAASEEREMERRRIRERSEREQRENAARLARKQSRIDGESDENTAGNAGSDNADTRRNQYSYGKGD